jgi:hypothetical protein
MINQPIAVLPAKNTKNVTTPTIVEFPRLSYISADNAPNELTPEQSYKPTHTFPPL